MECDRREAWRSTSFIAAEDVETASIAAGEEVSGIASLSRSNHDSGKNGSSRATLCQLPKVPVERQRYWLEAGRGAAGDVTSVGLSPAEHPLLGASLAMAEGDSFVFTGRLSLATHAWLGGHMVFGAVLLPGTGFVELALAAGSGLGWRRSRS